MHDMDSFSDAYSPMQPFRDWYNGEGIFAGAIIGSCSVALPAVQTSLADLVNSLNPGANWTYGEATAVLVQGVDATSFSFYPYPGAQAFDIKAGNIGPYTTAFPFWLARNRAQLVNMMLADPSASGALLLLQFYTGNPNVTP